MDINSVVLLGRVISTVSFTAREERYNKAILSIKRNSGVNDHVTIITRDTIPEGYVKVCGELRSRRNDKRLEVYVFAQEISPASVAMSENEFVVEGYVCSEPYYKQTKTKSLSQFLICIEGNRQSYASVIVWDKVGFHPGDHIAVTGRIQSRKYIKDDNIIEINELSAHYVPKLCQQNCQQIC